MEATSIATVDVVDEGDDCLNDLQESRMTWDEMSVKLVDAG